MNFPSGISWGLLLLFKDHAHTQKNILTLKVRWRCKSCHIFCVGTLFSKYNLTNNLSPVWSTVWTFMLPLASYRKYVNANIEEKYSLNNKRFCSSFQSCVDLTFNSKFNSGYQQNWIYYMLRAHVHKHINRVFWTCKEVNRVLFLLKTCASIAKINIVLGHKEKKVQDLHVFLPCTCSDHRSTKTEKITALGSYKSRYTWHPSGLIFASFHRGHVKSLKIIAYYFVSKKEAILKWKASTNSLQALIMHIKIITTAFHL